MAKHQIKHRWNNSVLFECDVPDDMESGLHARYALEKAVESSANLTCANLTGANLTGANLTCAYLTGANLTCAYLSDANLTCAYLSDANLTGANLTSANLTCANLTGANLTCANLTCAYLSDANLTCAYLSDANLTCAKWHDGITINEAPIQLFGLRWRVTILDEHMQIGCELHKLSEWASYDDARIAAMDGREALRFWRAHKTALLGLARSAGRGLTEAPLEVVEPETTKPA